MKERLIFAGISSIIALFFIGITFGDFGVGFGVGLIVFFIVMLITSKNFIARSHKNKEARDNLYKIQQEEAARERGRQQAREEVREEQRHKQDYKKMLGGSGIFK